MSKRTLWSFKEELKPCGETGKIRLMSDRGNVAHILAKQVETHPWFIFLWEPLLTKAPGPHLTQPYCCYINTVIFYLRGYIIRPFSKLYGGPHNWRVNRGQGGKTRGIEFEFWDRVESALRCDAVVEFNGELFNCHPGRVVWKNKRWWIVRAARREAKK